MVVAQYEQCPPRKMKVQINMPQTWSMGMTVKWWKVILRYLIEGIEKQNSLVVMIKMYETLLDKWELRRIMYSRMKLSCFCQVTQKLLSKLQQWCTTAFKGILHAEIIHITASNTVYRKYIAPLKYIFHCIASLSGGCRQLLDYYVQHYILS